MFRRIVICLLLTLLLLTVAQAQQPKKITRIGYLAAADPATDSARSEAVRGALRELGYLEGENIAIDYQYAAGKRDRYPALVNELLRVKVELS